MLSKKLGVVVVGFCLVLSSCAPKKSLSGAAEAGPNDFSFHFRQGISFLNRGEYESAEEEFTKALALNPSSARAYNLRGVASFQLRNYKNAEEQFQKAVALDPSYAEAYNNLGSLYFAKRQFQKAEEMFRKTLSLSPDSVSPLYSLGTLLLIQGKREEGTTYLARGIGLDPEFLEKHRAMVLELSTSGAETPEVYFAYAKAYAARGNIDKTVEFLEKAQKAGFRDWRRIKEEKEFETVREDRRVKEFVR